MPTNSPASSPPARLEALTGVRALAAFAVVILHWSHDLVTLWPAWAGFHGVTDQGELGVDLFFILSGFVLVHNYRSKFVIFSGREFGRFLWLRLARIYPAYLAALLGMMALVVAAKFVGASYRASAYPLAVLPWEILLFHAWRPGPLLSGWNYPDWSVSAEWFGYSVIFLPTVWVVNRLKSPWISVGIAAGALALYNSGFGTGERPNRLDHELPYITCYFIAGAMMWRPWQAWAPRWNSAERGNGWLWLPLILIPVLVLTPGGYHAARTIPLSFVFWLYLFTLAVDRSGPAQLHSRRWLIYWGEVSYALYLSHGLVIRLIKSTLPAERFQHSSWYVQGAWAALALVLTAGAAMLLHHGVEQPARRWLRRRAPAEPALPGAPSGAATL